MAWQERLYLEHAAKDSALVRTFSIDTVFAPGEYTLRVSKDGGQVHLLTLVFGSSLIGSVIDYSIHFLADRFRIRDPL